MICDFVIPEGIGVEVSTWQVAFSIAGGISFLVSR